MTYLQLVAITLCAMLSVSAAAANRFTIAVIPDTQNYVDYNHRKSAGYQLDGSQIFLQQMGWVAGKSRVNGGDIVFSISLGDMWQHASVLIDPEHVGRGFRAIPWEDSNAWIRPETRSFEMPLVAKGYLLIADKLPFSVVPGNHDFDSQWSDAEFPPNPSIKTDAREGAYVAGGLSNFRSIFDANSSFFKNKSWYVGTSPSGGDSADLFEAGGYRFLQISLQYHTPNSSLIWAQGIIKRYKGLPTIVSTHAFLKTPGERLNDLISDLEENNPEVVWQKFISQNDQIFLVLSGHWCAQAHRRDDNRFGHSVDQVLSDYQCRWQAARDAGAREMGLGLGDGWMRLLQFDLDEAIPSIHVRTYSTFYNAFSSDLPTYAQWYKKDEWPTLSDADFLKQDDFVIYLGDFRERFLSRGSISQSD